MREIKFRVWDSKVKELNYESATEILLNVQLGVYKKSVYKDYPFSFMQYTGLKDKKGVEIYEGDVVKSTLPRNKFFDDIAKVVFRKGSFMMKSVEFEDETSCLIDSEQFIEVIGNIYESSELLCKN